MTELGPFSDLSENTKKALLDMGEELAQQRLARSIVWLIFLLPTTVILASIANGCVLDTLSHNYYQPVTGVFFIFILGACCISLWRFHGVNRYENIAASVLAILLLGLALVPTSGSGCQKSPFQGWAVVDVTLEDGAVRLVPAALNTEDKNSGAKSLEQLSDKYFALEQFGANLHFYIAIAVFAVLVGMCFFVFTHVEPHQKGGNGELSDAKAARNKTYKFVGWIMVVLLGAIAVVDLLLESPDWWIDANGTLVCEALALLAFAYAWFVRSRGAQIYRDLRDDDLRKLPSLTI